MTPGFRDFVDAMDREREAFLTGQDRPCQVRREILTSWRRSSLCGVDPSVEELPYRDEVDLGSRLYVAASPVLTRLAERLADTSTAVLLADPEARIVARWASDKQLLRTMDRTESAPGFSLSEEICGTNGLGSVIEERRPLYVMGPEHFADRFMVYACYGAPILHPVSRRLEGVVTLVCDVKHTSPLMMPFIQETGQTIVDRLRDVVGWRDRYLLDSFGQAVRRTRRAVLALNEHTIIASPSAARLLDSADHAVLWESAADAIVQRRRTNELICLRSGQTVRIHGEPVLEGDCMVGALVELEILESEGEPPGSTRGGRQPAADRRLLAHLGGSSAAWVETIRAVAPVVCSDEPLLLSGEPGVGKLTIARAVHQVSGRAGELRVLNAALIAVDGLSVWLGRLRSALQEPGAVVLRRLDALEPTGANALAGLLDEHRDAHPEPDAPRVMGLVTTEPHTAPFARSPHLDRIGVHRVVVPPLRERVEDIPELITRLAQRSPRDVKFSPDALQVLLRAPWPGNVRELESLLRAVAATPRTGSITLDDLPIDVMQASNSGLTQLEQMEKQAILRSLRRAQGNKKLAAEELGISRSTLYRKLRTFGVDLDRNAF